MSSSLAADNVFDAMEAGDWHQVHGIIATASLTSEDLEKKHGVKCSSIL